MSECAGRFFVLNGKLVLSEKFDKALVYEGESAYEVLRIMQGVPVFFDDHMERLTSSVKSSGKDLIAGKPEIRDAIIRLIDSEGILNSNLKIVFNYKNYSSHFLIYFVETSYPTPGMYKNGVKGILVKAERKDPGSKVIDQKLRFAITKELSTRKAYEAILVNERDEVTEGSRSNIFFLKNNMLVTAPENYVLNGITRRNILKICSENDIAIEFRCLPVKDLAYYDAVIMTGTSPVAIPFSQVDDLVFKTGFQMIRRLRQLYFEKAEESIRLFRQLG